MRTMSAFNAAWFVLKKDEGLGEQPRASVEAQNFYDRRRGAIRGNNRGSSIPVEERRQMARAGEINPEKGVFARSPDNPARASHLPEKRPKAPMGTNPMQGDETNLMESPAMLSTEEIAERERENVPDRRQRLQFGKSSAFDTAWSMLKGRVESSFDAPPATGKKQHPSTSYGERNPAMTRKPGASLRTGPVAAQASQEEMDEFMRINSPEEHQEMLEAESLRDGNRSPADEMRLRGLESVFSRPDKAAGRLAAADVMHGQDIQNIFEEQGIPVRSSVERDAERNVFKPRVELSGDYGFKTALRYLNPELYHEGTSDRLRSN